MEACLGAEWEEPARFAEGCLVQWTGSRSVGSEIGLLLVVSSQVGKGMRYSAFVLKSLIDFLDEVVQNVTFVRVDERIGLIS